MFAILLTFISAISISVIAAGYSIIGLTTLFAGAFWPIVAMGSVLEVGKLVAASWLYNNWHNKIVPKTIRAYLTTAVVVLIFVTSMGIFGFLSKAHLDQVEPNANNSVQINLIDKQIKQQETIILRAENTLIQLDKSIEVYLDNDFATRGLRERKKQEPERAELNSIIEEATNKIIKLNTDKSALEIENAKIEAEVGPLKYVAELIYGDEAADHFDKAVRWVIMVLIFVFDPLAVLLLIAANISLRSYSEDKKKVKQKATKDTEKKLANEQAKTKALRDRDKIYKNFFKKLGQSNLKNKDYEDFFREVGSEELKKLGLDADAIRIKLDQIMEWNDLPTTSTKPKRYLEVDNVEKK